jgi:acetolactate synthase-1/2/3 large subunit
VSYAGRVIDSYEPGCWLDPGPFGCLGSGRATRWRPSSRTPSAQVVLLLGDGAVRLQRMEFDTLARHGVNVGRRDGQQRHLGAREAPDGVPLRLLGRGRAAAGTRYDEVVAALGGHGELVERPGELRPRSSARSRPGARARQRASPDPDVVYPRRSNLA